MRTIRAYRFPSLDVAGENNAKVLCFSEINGTKYYINYDGSKGAWDEETGSISLGSNVYSDNTCQTAVGTVSNGKEGFVVEIGSKITYTASQLTNPKYNEFYDADGNKLTYTNTFANGTGELKFNGTLAKIGDNAFKSKSDLTSVTLPDSLTYISESAFNGCTGLPVENYIRYAGTCAVETTDKTQTTYTFKSGTRYIGGGLFYNITTLVNISLPSTVIFIGKQAFRQCTNLTTINIPDQVIYIGDGAFESCNSLPTVNGCRYADTYLVKYPDGNATSVTFKEGTKWIGHKAFQYCNKLTTISIPASIVHIAPDAFIGTKISTITVDGNNPVYDSRNSCNAIIETATNTLVIGCNSTVIPNTVTTIGKYAFYDYSNLTGITIPNGVTKIMDYAFWQCAITSIDIPNSVTYIGYEAFAFNKLDSIIIGSGVTFLAEDAFFSGYTGTAYTIPSLVKINNVTYAYDGSDTELTVTLANGTEVTLSMYSESACFLPDTLITLSDNTTKQIKDITYNDELKVWNFDEGKFDKANIAWLTRSGLHNDHYYKLTFSDGTILKTTGTNSNHKVYNIDDKFFEGVAYIEIGKHVFTENGVVTLVNKEYIEEDVEYYNLITEHHFNCFANGVLTSDRYGNIYKIDENMMFIKEQRPYRPYSEFEAAGISEYWYDVFRYSENADSIDKIKKYIKRIESQMRVK